MERHPKKLNLLHLRINLRGIDQKYNSPKYKGDFLRAQQDREFARIFKGTVMYSLTGNIKHIGY